MRILITGAGGFLGKAIAASLAEAGHEIVACHSPTDRRTNTPAGRRYFLRLPDAALRAILQAEQPDWLIHCAGTARVSRSFEDPARDQLDNVGATECVYRSLAEASPRTHCIFLSSAAVYGQPTHLPITEQTRVAPISPYGRHKYRCEVLGRQYHESHGLAVVNLRLFSVYGPGLTKQVLFDLYQKLKKSDTVTLEGTGNERRDFIHIRDVTQIVNGLVRRAPTGFEVINVASGNSITIGELAHRFVNFWGGRRILFSGVLSPGVPSCWEADVGRLRQLGFASAISLNEGLGQYAYWLSATLEGAGDAHRVLAVAG